MSSWLTEDVCLFGHMPEGGGIEPRTTDTCAAKVQELHVFAGPAVHFQAHRQTLCRKTHRHGDPGKRGATRRERVLGQLDRRNDAAGDGDFLARVQWRSGDRCGGEE